MSNEGLLAVTDELSKCIHLLTKDGKAVRSIGKGVLGNFSYGIAFDPKGNVWVSDHNNNKVIKLSQDGRLLQTIHHAGSERDCLSFPYGISVSTEGLIYICDSDNCRVTVHDEDGKFLFAFGSNKTCSGHFRWPHDIAFGSDGLVYVSDVGSKQLSVWSKEGTFRRNFPTTFYPSCIAATSDNHLLITSYYSDIVMVYTLEGEPVHQFGVRRSHPERFSGPWGICVDDNGVVYVADWVNNCMQVF